MPSVPAFSWWLSKRPLSQRFVHRLTQSKLIEKQSPSPKNPTHLAIQWPWIDYWLVGSKTSEIAVVNICVLPVFLDGSTKEGWCCILLVMKQTTPGPTLVKGSYQSPCFDLISHIHWVFTYIHINSRHVTWFWCCIFSSVSQRLRLLPKQARKVILRFLKQIDGSTVTKPRNQVAHAWRNNLSPYEYLDSDFHLENFPEQLLNS